MGNKVACLGLFVTLALIFTYVETLIPFSFGVPGMKLGLTNIVLVLLLYWYGPKEALFVSILRIFLAGFLFGSFFGILYSLSGALLSLCIMTGARKIQDFGMIGVSILGGVFHNRGQLFVAMIVVSNYHIGFYLPALLLSGTVTGWFIGFLARQISMRISNKIEK